MQFKTALLSTAVVAALAGVTVHNLRSGTAAGTATAQNPAVAKPATAAPAAGAQPVSAQAVAAAERHAAGLRALIDTTSRPGARRAWSSSSPEQADRTAAAERARGLLATAAAREVNLAHNDGFNARDVMIDRDGTEHVRMERSYQGLPVIGGDMVVHSRNGELLSVSQNDNLRTTLRPAIAPGIDADRARAEAGSHFDGRVAEVDPAKLVVYARGGMEPTLAYQVDLRGDRADDQLPGSFSYFLDARDGRLLQAEDHIQTASGTAKTINLGDVGIQAQWTKGGEYVFTPTGMTLTPDGYRLVDATRGSGQTLDANDSLSTYSTVPLIDGDNVWGNNAASDRSTAAGEAHYGISATWDYYKTVQGRNGVFNNGTGVKSYVHYGKNYVNAAWDLSKKVMYYGDGNPAQGIAPMVALDVAGHEMAHGVSQATANFGYYGIKDTGGLNEAVSDAFGTLVEFSVANAKDPGDFLIGENLFLQPDGKKAMRVMFQQNLDIARYPNDPSIKCYPAGGFTAALTNKGKIYDPHNTSGVGNLAFYLVSQGSKVPDNYPEVATADLACNGDASVVGIGLAKAGAIWYRALTTYFTSATDYPGARKGTLQATSDLYGANSAEYQTVARAWSAVNVN